MVSAGRTREHRGRAGQALKRPRQRRRRAVVAAHQQRHQLIAQALIGGRVAVLVALGQQQ
jgi:hypothetical protein